jgi:thiamine-monophosphate kinase
MANEFEFIEHIKSKYSLRGIGDDCAVLPRDSITDLLITADMLIEDIDFRLEWTTPELLGRKALAVSLSDIAAMGGNPVWAMLSIGVPNDIWSSDFVNRFYQGWFALANEYQVELVGGDVSRSPDKLVIDSIVGGEVEKGRAILRSTAKPGDLIFVSGTLGGAAGGLKLLERGFGITDDLEDLTSKLVLQQLNPLPQLHIANELQHLGKITSMIDLSDGVSSDLGHICRMSGVGARINVDRLPIDDDLRNYFHSDDCLEMALHGGEDFELLFTVSQDSSDEIHGTCIGEITDGDLEIIANGKTSLLEAKGFEHFE